MRISSFSSIFVTHQLVSNHTYANTWQKESLSLLLSNELQTPFNVLFSSVYTHYTFELQCFTSDDECRYDNHGIYYKGHKSVTQSGKECIHWSEVSIPSLTANLQGWSFQFLSVNVVRSFELDVVNMDVPSL